MKYENLENYLDFRQKIKQQMNEGLCLNYIVNNYNPFLESDCKDVCQGVNGCRNYHNADNLSKKYMDDIIGWLYQRKSE